MTAPGTPTGRDYRCIRIIAIISLAVLAAVGVANVLVSPPVAPRVNVRWADGVTDEERVRLESRLQLLAGERREGTTWAYDLGNPSWLAVRALIGEPAVADTHYINRRFGMVSADAPRGTTPLTGGALSAWRDSTAARWIARVAVWLLVVSTLWLVTNGRRVRARSVSDSAPSHS